ncbi:unnamed protein product [Echinostoma caproni]|uniref:Anaphase-promoting complex subunit 4 n=1 Tax=Echinostoma caproni TaxID=27848 RepID=A0A3P8G6U6_9TREM|nr:unnamed protein product [Echinostoma caproni]
MRKFLVEDWTAANLKRTGMATLKAYESIKTICFQQLQLLLQRLLFHASELLGCVRDAPSYAQFEISPAQVVQLCSTTGAVLQKTQELYLIIEKSVAHLRAFFKWLYVAIPGLSGRVLPDDFPRVTPTERELVIDFITNYLQPVFVLGELQSYHVDLVEQVQPFAALGLLTSTNHNHVTSDTTRIHFGMFHYNPKASLADLIKKNLQDDIDSVFQAPGSENFTRGCINFELAKSYLLYRSSSPDPPFGDIPMAFHALKRPSITDAKSSLPVSESDITLVACKLPVLDPSTHDSIALMHLDPDYPNSKNSRLSAVVTVDELPSVTNPHNLPYELVDFEFYTSDLLLLLVCRAKTPGHTPGMRSDSTREPVLSWLVMLPLDTVFSASGESHSPFDAQHRIRLSEVVTQSNVESLPWHAVQIATNGERSIVFVLFRGLSTCRVYLLERLEPDGSRNETADDLGGENDMETTTGDGPNA